MYVVYLCVSIYAFDKECTNSTSHDFSKKQNNKTFNLSKKLRFSKPWFLFLSFVSLKRFNMSRSRVCRAVKGSDSDLFFFHYLDNVRIQGVEMMHNLQLPSFLHIEIYKYIFYIF